MQMTKRIFLAGGGREADSRIKTRMQCRFSEKLFSVVKLLALLCTKKWKEIDQEASSNKDASPKVYGLFMAGLSTTSKWVIEAGEGRTAFVPVRLSHCGSGQIPSGVPKMKLPRLRGLLSDIDSFQDKISISPTRGTFD